MYLHARRETRLDTSTDGESRDILFGMEEVDYLLVLNSSRLSQQDKFT